MPANPATCPHCSHPLPTESVPPDVQQTCPICHRSLTIHESAHSPVAGHAPPFGEVGHENQDPVIPLALDQRGHARDGESLTPPAATDSKG